MNKTVSINIGGLFFHIDDNAFTKLNNYLEAIKSSLSEDSKEEVMNDIEARIGEILSSRIQPDKQVINGLDIDYIISVMGQPEDYIIEDEDQSNKTYSKSSYNSFESSFNKKLFRDEDGGKIGGVCSGLAYYFNIDTIWVRILFILALIFTNGIGFMVYLGLWIMVPKAVTTSEKLQMRGEAINISNIEKKVKEGYDKIANSINEFNQSDLKKDIVNTSSNAVNNVESFAKGFFNVVTKIIGVVLFLISLLSIGTLLIFCGLLMVNSAVLIENNVAINVPFEGVSLFTFGLLTLITSCVPLLFLFFLSLKILNPGFKYLGRYSILSLIAIWIIAIFGWIFFGINQSLYESQTSKNTTKTTLNFSPSDTLKINMNNNSFYSVETDPNYSGKILKDENGKKIFYSNNVEIEFKESESNEAYLVVEKKSKNKTLEKATTEAANINFNITTNSNEIILDNYFTSDNSSKNKQRITVYVFVPKNTNIKFNKIAKKYTNSIFNNYDTNSLVYQLNENENLVCNTCEESNNKTIEIKINDTKVTELEKEVDSILNAIN